MIGDRSHSSGVFTHDGTRGCEPGCQIVFQRLHIRPSRIPAAGGVTSRNARPPPHLAGIRAGGLTRFAFPPAFIRMYRTVASKTHARCSMKIAPQVAYRCGDSTD
ncbi:MAG: hypothetical protein PCALPYG08_6487 [uncultured Paraburkholderia sp.]|nr:MAG: hypothetical protein PCALPYG08_6487 [uncultured Paraburkholderia sp.]